MTNTSAPSTNHEAFDNAVRDLHHHVWEIRRDVCDELGTIGDARAVSYLIQALTDGVGAVRFAAATALGKLGDKSAIPALLALLEDSRFGAYGPVIESLANLKAYEAVPVFIRFLRDHDPRVRGLAANALMVITRQFIGFKAKGLEEERLAAIEQWEKWWEKNKATMLP
ncbi:MAG: HEAT repeat domain-containing protein [Planctomycetota bacterium]